MPPRGEQKRSKSPVGQRLQHYNQSGTIEEQGKGNLRDGSSEEEDPDKGGRGIEVGNGRFFGDGHLSRGALA